MKKTVICTVLLLAYCAGYNIIQHGAERNFFIGLALTIIAEAAFYMSIKNGFKIYPDEPDYYDAYFNEEEKNDEHLRDHSA